MVYKSKDVRRCSSDKISDPITGWKYILGKDASYIKITLKYLYVGIGKP